MNKPIESPTSHATGRTDGIDPKPGDAKVIAPQHEPAPVSATSQRHSETRSAPSAKEQADAAAASATVKQEMARSTRAVKQGAQQALGFSQAIGMMASDMMQRYIANIERGTQRYCYAVNAYLDAFREELSRPERGYQEEDALHQTSPSSYSLHARSESGGSDARVQNRRA